MNLLFSSFSSKRSASTTSVIIKNYFSIVHELKVLTLLWCISCLVASSSSTSPEPSPSSCTGMPTAKWNGVVLAESNDIVEVEGNKYFPLSSLKMDYFKKNSQTTTCPWKGTANYFDVVVDGKTNSGAAWYYANPKPEAAKIKDRVAFWKGVSVS